MIGEKEVLSVSVGNFGSTTYNQTSRGGLGEHIASLKSQINKASGCATKAVDESEF